MTKGETDTNTKKIYEVSYHFVSSIPEEEVPARISVLQEQIEKLGGEVFRVGETEYTELAYPMERSIGNKKKEFSHSYFGWMKFEGSPEVARELHDLLSKNEDIVRFLIVKTIKEDTFFTKSAKAKKEEGGASEKEADPNPVRDADLDKTIEKLVIE